MMYLVKRSDISPLMLNKMPHQQHFYVLCKICTFSFMIFFYFLSYKMCTLNLNLKLHLFIPYLNETTKQCKAYSSSFALNYNNQRIHRYIYLSLTAVFKNTTHHSNTQYNTLSIKTIVNLLLFLCTVVHVFQYLFIVTQNSFWYID